MDDFPVNFTKDGFAWDGGSTTADRCPRPGGAEVRPFADNARVSKAQVEPQDFVRAVDEVQRGVDHPTYREAVSGAQAHSHHDVRPDRC